MAATKTRPYSELGARISSARNKTGLSQERFAPVVGITRRHLIRLENGEHQASQQVANRIAQETGVAASEFRFVEEAASTGGTFPRGARPADGSPRSSGAASATDEDVAA